MDFFTSKKERRASEANNFTNTLWFGMGLLMVVFFTLGAINTTLEFRTTVTFAIAYFGGWIYLWQVGKDWRGYKAYVQSTNANNPNTLWQENITKDKLVWVGAGIIGVFISVYISFTINDLVTSQLVGLTLSGIVILLALFKTEALLAPVWIHGTYNSFVIAVKLGFIKAQLFQPLSQSPINVPELVAGLNGAQRLGTEIIFQYMIVATAEELLKTAFLVFFMIALRRYLPPNQAKWTSGILSVLIWVGLHTIQAISV